ncbi:hypothetical protein EDD17DRAFT_139222 [Pisolithus thermaeus]|nr:hypothetical protein EDD17DRAFT_139222 [Pisolithus thermaeus]
MAVLPTTCGSSNATDGRRRNSCRESPRMSLRREDLRNGCMLVECARFNPRTFFLYIVSLSRPLSALSASPNAVSQGGSLYHRSCTSPPPLGVRYSSRVCSVLECWIILAHISISCFISPNKRLPSPWTKAKVRVARPGRHRTLPSNALGNRIAKCFRLSLCSEGTGIYNSIGRSFSGRTHSAVRRPANQKELPVSLGSQCRRQGYISLQSGRITHVGT